MDIFNTILSTFEHYSALAYLMIFASSLLESLAFVGLVVPGTSIIVAVGFLNSQGFFHFNVLAAFAIIGAVIGDGFSYYLGRYSHRFFKEDSKIFKMDYLARGTDFIRRHGAKSIFLGRFVGPLRAVVPFLAGTFKMDARKFFFYNIGSAICWSISYLALGYFFGQAWQAIAGWSTHLAIFAFWIILFLLVFYLLRWLFVKKGKKVILFLLSLARSMWEGIKDDPNVRAFTGRHPKLIGFLKRRVAEDEFSGQPMTVLAVAFAYGLWNFLATAYDITIGGYSLDVDMSLSNLLYSLRNPILTKIFLWATLFGKWQIVVAAALAVCILFYLWRKRQYIIPFIISIGGGVGFTQLAKMFWHRPRPSGILPVYFENSWSFPSAHAAVAVCLYGFLTYYFVKNLGRWKNKINSLFVGLFLIMAIGFSRLYLGVHFLSDVWAGYMMGLMWLLIGIGLIEWYEDKHKALALTSQGESDWKRGGFWKKTITVSLILANLCFYVGYAVKYKPQLNPGGETAVLTAIETKNVDRIFDDYQLPKFTETLTGNKQEPFSFIFVAKDGGTLIKDFTDAGWFLADDINFTSLGLTLKSEIWNKPYDTAPISPYFWKTYVHDFGFQKPTEKDTARNRHHARVWSTGFINADGENIYVGIASLDTGVKWWGMTHRIKPDIDTEREYVFQTLRQADKVVNFEKKQFVDRVLGTNFTGDVFFTDGQIYILYLK